MPFAGYADFQDCVADNQDKDSPEGFCAWLHYRATGTWPAEASKAAIKEAKEIMAKTTTFTGVEIARTGTYEAKTGRVTFTTKDFDEAEKAYKALHDKHQAVIKLGHDEHQKLLQEDGFPNAGFLENIRREGDKLLADLIDIPEKIASLVQAGRYNARSIEAMRNFEIDGKKWPFVITGLALLGADLPAIDSLEDVAAVYASQGLELPENAIIVIMTDDIKASQGGNDVEALINELQSLLSRTESIIHHKGGAPKFRTLVKAAVQELRAIAKIKTSKEVKDMELTKLIEVLGLAEDSTEDAVLASLTELKAKADKDGQEDEATAQLKKDLADAQKRIVKLESDSASKEATSAVDEAIKARKFTPASRDTLIKMAVGNPAEFGELVKATPDNAVLASKELGRDGDGGDNIGELEPTQDELNIAAKLGLSREDLIEQKAHDRGIDVPQSVAEVLAERRK